MQKKIVCTNEAPKAIGPYSQAVYINDFLFVSGQLPIDPYKGTMPDSIKEQTNQSLKNIKGIVNTAGLNMSDVVKTTIYLKDLNHFSDVNVVYETYFSQNPPARVCVEIARLPKDALIEIEAIAYGKIDKP